MTICDALQASVLLRKARDQAIPFALGWPVLLQVASPGRLKAESESPVCRVSPSTRAVYYYLFAAYYNCEGVYT